MRTSEYIDTTSLSYSLYVLKERAIPSMTDGLKSVQRIALHLMEKEPKAIKTVGLVGRMMESGLYVHGDKSAEDAISRLAAPYVNNHCLLQGEGAFGNRIAPIEGIGAARYTEIKRSKFAVEHLYVDSDIAPTRENYDGSRLMPQTFLPILPLVLLNGTSGIAVGFANKILPRKLEDLREAVLEVLKTGACTHPLMPHFENYDARVIRDPRIKSKYYISGRVSIINTSTVEITELPPGMTLDKVKERLIQLEDEKKITTFDDNSTDTISITVKMPRAALSGMTESNLVQMFKLTQAETENITVVHPSGEGVTVYQSPQELVVDFVNWRAGLYRDRYENLKTLEEHTSLFWRSFLTCFESPGDGKRSVAASISGIKSRNDLAEKIIDSIEDNDLPVDDDVVDRILYLPVYRYTKSGQAEAREKAKAAAKLIKEYDDILQSPTKLKSIYKKEVIGNK